MGAISMSMFTLLALSCVAQVHGVYLGYKVGGGGFDNVAVAGSCNMFQGNWVYDESYPLYDVANCPFIEKEFDCLHNGRPDKYYLKYRWQPSSCNLPRFNGEELMEKMRGKSIMFVGDSLSLNQWQSLTCMLHTAAPHVQYSNIRTGDLSTFTFKSYDLKLLFSRNAFLVDIVGTPGGRILKLDSVNGGNLWKSNIDVLIFNTWHWWLHTGRKQPWDWVEEGNKRYKDMDRLVAYEKALRTWANWVDSNVNPTKTQVFFQGVSPDHNNASDWGEAKAKNCAAETRPIRGGGGIHPAEQVVEKVLGSMKQAGVVKLLDVTAMSQLRVDGHPSVFGHGGHRDMDCSHWCLPGVPDIWNQLFSAMLMHHA